ncbi:hypothetical protein L1987_55626 [Smallanthus sonchifolius]|uniref:Uncharacterized protein n=1 Tax=Smallanthus sonchifolius TaxID=185202 RepID=A0ACB9EA47_9ASTR|nr:hypothetical protein L1987_55626 [Smallanthus sonchifolius]
MGFWDVVYYTGDLLKGITPDISTVKRAGGVAYSCTSDAVTKIDQLVRVDGIQKLPQYWPDDEARAQIGLFTTTFAKNAGKYAVYEGFEHIPGASAKVDKLDKDVMKLTSQPENFIQNGKLSSENAVEGGSEKTKDMINTFMKTELVGNHMFRDLMVPKIAHMENNKN